MAMSEKPDVTYADIGGMDIQKQEIKVGWGDWATHAKLFFVDLFSTLSANKESVSNPFGQRWWDVVLCFFLKKSVLLILIFFLLVLKPPKETSVQEAVELPLTHKELYAQIGIDPPSGVLLYGPPGTGKTMLAKAVANMTTATFIRASGLKLM